MGFDNPFFFCIFVTTYLIDTVMTTEERLGNVRTYLEKLMSLTYDEALNSKAIGYTYDFVEHYQLLIGYFTLWSKCIDSDNVIDAHNFNMWDFKIKILKNE
jgi:hypothetical protein